AFAAWIISAATSGRRIKPQPFPFGATLCAGQDRKSTRLNSSHVSNSYAVFCLKKKMLELYIVLLRQLQLVHHEDSRSVPLRDESGDPHRLGRARIAHTRQISCALVERGDERLK